MSEKDEAKRSHKAALRDIKLAKARVELKSLEGDYELDQIRLRSARADATWKKGGDRNHGVFRLEAMVSSSALDLAAEIQQYCRVNPGKPITLYICSPGGSVFSGWVLYDALRTAAAQGHHITTVVRGYAASMAGVLFLAGDTRVVGSESYVMIHEVSTMALGKLSELSDEVDFAKRLNRRIEDLYVSRTKIKRAEFRKRSTRVDWWIDSDEALQLGIAHEKG